MNYPCIIGCQQCGKLIPALRPSKKFCSGKCKLKSYRIQNGLPLTWKPDPTKRKVMIGETPNPNQYDLFTIQMVETDKGLRKIMVDKKTGKPTVFAIVDGKEILIK
jgi:hypothetical protein